jgi:hypothetical protein
MRLKLPQIVIVKSPGLLPMRYKLPELSAKLGVHPRTLSDWTDQGAPHEHDARGHIWIIGTDFAQWVEMVRLQNKKVSGEKKLSDDQAYCVRCRKPVDLIAPIITPGHGKLIYIKGLCPNCGIKINRAGRNND